MGGPTDDSDASVQAGIREASSLLRNTLSGGTARSLLLTTLSEFVLPAEEPVWTATLLYVLNGLGIEEQAGRQAISRIADKGWLAREKHGRLVRWKLTDAGIGFIEETTRRALFLSSVPEVWDGNGLILVVSVPKERQAIRQRLYRALNWAGFGNPAPGLWATPHADRVDEMRKILKDFGLQGSAFAFRGNTVSGGLSDNEIIERAWDFDDVAGRYKRFIETFEGLKPKPGDDLLFAYIALVHEWQQFPSMDPQLPRNFLPDWIGRRATEIVREMQKEWSGAVRLHWQEIVRSTSPRL
jgi:phenylacetic acid degradation operon negative regulatory protein